jgi:internalin A
MTREIALARIQEAAEQGLTELDLAGLGLTAVPPEVAQLTRLETLILGKRDGDGWASLQGRDVPAVITNEIHELPSFIGKLQNLRYLDLSGNPLGCVPEVIYQLPQLERLGLCRLLLKATPSELAQLQPLQQLDLSGNLLTELPSEIGQLSNLQSLDLRSSQLSTLPEAIAQLSCLQSLDLSENLLTNLPEVVGRLSNLKSLDLGWNQLSTLPEVIGQLSNLQSLYLNSNQLSTLPEVIGQLSNLQSLSLSSNQLSTLPEVIGQLSNLQSLSLSSNQLSTLPEVIGQLSNLQSLDLSFNQLTTLPEGVGQLSNLQSFSLSANQLTTLPEGIGQLTNLQSLDLGDNQLTTLPEGIGQLTNLQSLDLSINRLRTLPEGIGQLTNLQSLDLRVNRLRTLPEGIGQLTNLQSLDLSYNQLSALPEGIGQLTNLRELKLGDQLFGGNKLTTLPPEIGQLTNLQSLDLYNNQLSTLPEVIGQLTNLQSLDLSRNQITEIPESLEMLPLIKTLDLRRNRLPISPEILGPSNLDRPPGAIEDIFNYLRQLRSGEVRPLNEAKLLLVGQGSVGKTSLIKRLIDNQFNPAQPQTDGLNVRNWSVHVNSKDVRLNVWDFGGQEIYHATHQFFLTKRSLYILVCNCRTSEEENRLEHWLKLIESFGGESPVIIVGNKCDEQPLDINRKALRDKYPNIKAILETSCQTADGIDQLHKAIRAEVGQMREVYNLLPLSWFEVKERLETLDRDFISYNEYIGICYQNAISEERNQEQLIDLLHDIGLVLNFREHPLLQNTNVLNPDWVTTGIYTLLSDPDLKTQAKGQLTLADMSRILPAERYPAERHKYLVDLMKEFQLCFELILEAVQWHEAVPGDFDEYGQRYIVDFPVTRNQNTANVRTIWIIRTDETFPRLVSCYVLR